MGFRQAKYGNYEHKDHQLRYSIECLIVKRFVSLHVQLDGKAKSINPNRFYLALQVASHCVSVAISSSTIISRFPVFQESESSHSPGVLADTLFCRKLTFGRKSSCGEWHTTLAEFTNTRACIYSAFHMYWTIFISVSTFSLRRDTAPFSFIRFFTVILGVFNRILAIPRHAIIYVSKRYSRGWII